MQTLKYASKCPTIAFLNMIAFVADVSDLKSILLKADENSRYPKNSYHGILCFCLTLMETPHGFLKMWPNILNNEAVEDMGDL